MYRASQGIAIGRLDTSTLKAGEMNHRSDPDTLGFWCESWFPRVVLKVGLNGPKSHIYISISWKDIQGLPFHHLRKFP